MFKFLFVTMCSLLVLCPIAAEGLPVESTSRMDWARGKLLITLTVSLKDLGTPTEARAKAEELMERKIGPVFSEILGDIILDSSRTVEMAAANDPKTLARLLEFGGARKPKSIHMDRQLESIIALYEFELFPNIVSIFVKHLSPYSPEKVLGFFPTVEYSGIVIYVKGEYPVHGETTDQNNAARFVPSLYPRIYDTGMRLVAEAEMMDISALNTWGLAAYSDSTDYLSYKYRVGPTPLLTMAREIFGDFRTDIIIPANVADRILASEHNRYLIRQGRVLIIYGP